MVLIGGGNKKKTQYAVGGRGVIGTGIRAIGLREGRFTPLNLGVAVRVAAFQV